MVKFAVLLRIQARLDLTGASHPENEICITFCGLIVLNPTEPPMRTWYTKSTCARLRDGYCMDNYCIKPGYTPRTEAPTLVGDIREYWDNERQLAANSFQWPVYSAAARYLAESGKQSFVDVGCGYPAKIAALIAPVTGDITLIDQPSMATLMAGEFPDFHFIPHNLESTADDIEVTADCVVCADVIEHLMNPRPLIALLRQLLKPGARLFISTPERDKVRGTHCNFSPNPEHVREWNQQEFHALLSSSGLRVLEHVCLPQKRTAKYLPIGLLGTLRPAQYLGCQLAICELA